MVDVIKGNVREVPPGLPPMTWWDRLREVKGLPILSELPWYLPELEYLTPDELATMRAKALVWYEVTEEWPRDISTWWEVRMARRRGDLPQCQETVVCHVNDEGALVCGKCQARWSAHRDGSDWPNACKLCGVNWIKCLSKN